MQATRDPEEKGLHDRQCCIIGKRYSNNDQYVAVAVNCNFETDLDPPIFDMGVPGCVDREIRVPDVYVENDSGDVIAIIEVETAGTMATERTRCQLAVFSLNGPTIVYVPDGSEGMMLAKLREWELDDFVDVETY